MTTKWLRAKQMRAAVVARRVDMEAAAHENQEQAVQDILHGGALGETIAEQGAAYLEAREQYATGKKILGRYSLTFSAKFARGCPAPKVHEGYGVLEIAAGHVAGSEMRRLALFRPRTA